MEDFNLIETLKKSWEIVVALSAIIIAFFLQLKNIRTAASIIWQNFIAVVNFPKRLISTIDNLSQAIDALKSSMLEVHDLAAMSNAKVNMSLDESPVGRFECNLLGECVWVSESLQKLFKLDAAQMLGKGWLSRLHHDDIEKVHGKWVDTIKNWHPYRTRYRLLFDDGKVITVEATATVLKNAVGKPLTIWGKVIPISDIS